MNIHHIFFILRRDLQYTLREKSTLVWLTLMPLVFIYFIGSATGSAGGPRSERADRIAVSIPADAGLLADRVVTRLIENGFEVVRFDGQGNRLDSGDIPLERYARQLLLPAAMTDQVNAGEPVAASFSSSIQSIGGDYDKFRVQRAVYTVLADVMAASRSQFGLSAEGMAAVDAAPRQLMLVVRPAGQRKIIPSGFSQAVPGILVMFTLLVLTTSGAVLVFNERQQGLLRRLAATPITRAELVTGKWLGKAALGVIQIGFAMIAGTLLFGMDWGPNLLAVVLVMVLWALLCAGLALWLGSVGKSEGQVSGLGVMAANILAGLGGCWWPIEIAPQWMQGLQKTLPTGWVMDALHRLISFQGNIAEIAPHLVALTMGTLLMAWMSVRYFQYE